MNQGQIKANGKWIPLSEPATLENFLLQQNLLPRSVVVELNGQAVGPSEFKPRRVHPGDNLEIVRIVAGG